MARKAGPTTKELEDKIRNLEAEVAKLRTFENAPHHAVLEDMSECIVRWQTGGILLFVNDAYCRLFNKSREELIGTSFFSLIAPEDQAIVKSRLESLTPEKPISTDRHRAKGAGGSLIWMEWLDRLIFDAHGNPVEYQSVGRDITDRVLIQEHVRELERSEAVIRHTFELTHDLNNIFTVILGQLELLKLDQSGSLDPLEFGVKKGVDLLKQIRELRYSYLWQPIEIDLKEHVSNDLILLRELAGGTPITLQLPDEPCHIRGDAVQLDQVLWNLVRNADHAAEGQGLITVSVCRAEPDTLMSGHFWHDTRPDDCCVLRVSDEAGGIPESLQPTLFGAHISTRPEGQGLGLKTVKSIVDAHNGSLSYITSKSGTTFEVAFPAI